MAAYEWERPPVVWKHFRTAICATTAFSTNRLNEQFPKPKLECPDSSWKRVCTRATAPAFRIHIVFAVALFFV
jgi:hypothetical protein